MRSYEQPFGEVNTEQWILRLYTLTEGIRELYPLEQRLQVTSGSLQAFRVVPIFGSEVQRIDWTLNGEPIAPTGDSEIVLVPIDGGGTENPLFEANSLAQSLSNRFATEALANDTLSTLALTLLEGEHELTATVSDTSGRIRLSPPHAGIFSRTWSIEAR